MKNTKRKPYSVLLWTISDNSTTVAALLGIDKSTLFRRLSGESKVSREAYLAARYLAENAKERKLP